MTSDLITFTYDGTDVTFDPQTQMWNLNAMHRAAGSVPHKAPAQWLRSAQAQELIAALERKLNCGNFTQFIETREGRNGGTWTIQQLAIVYAHYLNPDFYLQWNEWALAYKEGKTSEQSVTRAEFEELRQQVIALQTYKTQHRRLPSTPPSDLRGTYQLVLTQLSTSDTGLTARRLLDSVDAHERMIYRTLARLKACGFIEQRHKGEAYTLTEAGRIVYEEMITLSA